MAARTDVSTQDLQHQDTKMLVIRNALATPHGKSSLLLPDVLAAGGRVEVPADCASCPRCCTGCLLAMLL
jgi:hypothetical protein